MARPKAQIFVWRLHLRDATRPPEALVPSVVLDAADAVLASRRYGPLVQPAVLATITHPEQGRIVVYGNGNPRRGLGVVWLYATPAPLGGWQLHMATDQSTDALLFTTGRVWHYSARMDTEVRLRLQAPTWVDLVPNRQEAAA